MASVITLALTQHVSGGAVFITLAYTLGTSIPMLAVMLGGRALLTRVPALTRNAANIQKGFGVLMIVMGVAIGLGWDRQFQSAILRAFPNYGSGLTAIEKAPSVRVALKTLRTWGNGRGQNSANSSGERVFSGAMDVTPQNGVLGDYGLAPAFVTNGMWFNTEGVVPMPGQPSEGGSMPLSLQSLRGKVVVVDFWTYSCVNCVRTLPYLKAWNDTYRSRGLVIVGVHTPEFEFEKKSANVERAIKDLGVDWPVVQDNDYSQWNAYANQFWPAHYFIDAKGHVRYFHFGEGEYDVSEKVIQALLKEAGTNVGGIVSKPAPEIDAQTPETYLGYGRGRGFASATVPVPDMVTDYTAGQGAAERRMEPQWQMDHHAAIRAARVLGDAAARVPGQERVSRDRAPGVGWKDHGQRGRPAWRGHRGRQGRSACAAGEPRIPACRIEAGRRTPVAPRSAGPGEAVRLHLRLKTMYRGRHGRRE